MMNNINQQIPRKSMDSGRNHQLDLQTSPLKPDLVMYLHQSQHQSQQCQYQHWAYNPSFSPSPNRDLLLPTYTHQYGSGQCHNWPYTQQSSNNHNSHPIGSLIPTYINIAGASTSINQPRSYSNYHLAIPSTQINNLALAVLTNGDLLSHGCCILDEKTRQTIDSEVC